MARKTKKPSNTIFIDFDRLPGVTTEQIASAINALYFTMKAVADPDTLHVGVYDGKKSLPKSADLNILQNVDTWYEVV